MRIDVEHDYGLRLREVFSGVAMETSEGNRISVCMRDDTFEINVIPDGFHSNNWWRVDMQDGTIKEKTSFRTVSER